MTGSRTVVLSIGMPAHNAEQTIRPAIESLLRQSFGDFELIISDNASKDGTWPVIEEYARRDDRIIALRQDRNVGANANFSAVFRPARGRYFKWASSNDWCAPEFLATCVAYLEAHADAALAAPRTRLFRDTPEDSSDYDSDVAFDDDDPVERFIGVTSRLALNNVLNGVIRTSALRRTRLMERYPQADIVLLGRIALMGKIALLGEPLYYRRMRSDAATPLMDDEARLRHLYPQPTARSLFPSWRLALGWVRAASSGAQPARATWRALAWTLRMAYWRRADLWADVAAAGRYPLHRVARRAGSSGSSR
jgi:glycosyltransferase involved in cell wall biosynthesis